MVAPGQHFRELRHKSVGKQSMNSGGSLQSPIHASVGSPQGKNQEMFNVNNLSVPNDYGMNQKSPASNKHNYSGMVGSSLLTAGSTRAGAFANNS